MQRGWYPEWNFFFPAGIGDGSSINAQHVIDSCWTISGLRCIMERSRDKNKKNIARMVSQFTQVLSGNSYVLYCVYFKQTLFCIMSRTDLSSIIQNKHIHSLILQIARNIWLAFPVWKPWIFDAHHILRNFCWLLSCKNSGKTLWRHSMPLWAMVVSWL